MSFDKDDQLERDGAYGKPSLDNLRAALWSAGDAAYPTACEALIEALEAENAKLRQACDPALINERDDLRVEGIELMTERDALREQVREQQELLAAITKASATIEEWVDAYEDVRDHLVKDDQ